MFCRGVIWRTRFPYTQLLFCLTCLATAAWTCILYSHRVDLDIRDIPWVGQRFWWSRETESVIDQPFSHLAGRYVRLHGLQGWYFARCEPIYMLARNGKAILIIDKMPCTPDLILPGYAYELDHPCSATGRFVWVESKCLPRNLALDTTASRSAAKVLRICSKEFHYRPSCLSSKRIRSVVRKGW